MTETEAARILQDLAQRYAVEPYDPAQDVTLTQLTEELGISAESARTILDKEVAAGRLSKRLVSIGKVKANAYRKRQ